jgi:hypothetical protein
MKGVETEKTDFPLFEQSKLKSRTTYILRIYYVLVDVGGQNKHIHVSCKICTRDYNLPNCPSH